MNRFLTLAMTSMTTLALAAPALSQAPLRDLIDADARARAGLSSSLADLADWGAYNRAGWRAIDKGYYDTAEHEFRAAIKAARRPGLDDPRLVARSYADYAWAVQLQGRHAEAEPSARWALLARQTLLDPGSPAIAQSLNQLATLYYELGRLEESEPLLRQAVEAQAGAPRADPREHARSHTLLGLQLVARRRYAESEPFFLGAVRLREKAMGPADPETGDGLNNLAWAYHEQGKDDEARPLFERALAILERSRGPRHPSVAHVLDGLGQIHAARGEVDRAEALFRRAIAIWEQVPGAGASELAQVLRRHARLLDGAGRTAERDRVEARIATLAAKTGPIEGKAAPWYQSPRPAPGAVTGTPRLGG